MAATVPTYPELEPPEPFALLIDVGKLLRRANAHRAGVNRDLHCRGIDQQAHRYPHSIVWTPIPLLTWVAPFVGHVGICCTEGRILDFAGKVRRDCMAFGWPARYVQVPLDAMGRASWDDGVDAAAREFSRGPCYSFFTWNCHSLCAAVLNGRLEQPEGSLAQRLGGWSVVSIACHLFFDGRYPGLRERLRHWLGPCFVWSAVVTVGVLDGFWRPAGTLLAINLAIFSWFAAMAVCGCDGQLGRVADPLPPRVDGGPASRSRAASGAASESETDDSEAEWHPAF